VLGEVIMKLSKVILVILVMQVAITLDVAYGATTSQPEEEIKKLQEQVNELEDKIEEKVDKEPYDTLYKATIERFQTEIESVNNDRDFYYYLLNVGLVVLGLISAFGIFNILYISNVSRKLRKINANAKDKISNIESINEQVTEKKSEVDTLSKEVEIRVKDVSEKSKEIKHKVDEIENVFLEIGKLEDQMKGKIEEMSSNLESFLQAIKEYKDTGDTDKLTDELKIVSDNAKKSVSIDPIEEKVKSGQEHDRKVGEIDIDNEEL
jgi:methyl-accepting chemotaxis protein